MKSRLNTLLFVILLSSCNDSLSKPVDKTPIESSSHPLDDKFIGVWKYYTSSFDKNSKGDGSMDGQLATLKILEGTEETYTFRFLHFALLFSRKDDSTLKGVDTKFTLQYHQSAHLLIFNMGKGKDFEVFEKLK